jgi:hypothetical protein
MLTLRYYITLYVHADKWLRLGEGRVSGSGFVTNGENGGDIQDGGLIKNIIIIIIRKLII